MSLSDRLRRLEALEEHYRPPERSLTVEIWRTDWHTGDVVNVRTGERLNPAECDRVGNGARWVTLNLEPIGRPHA